MTGGKNKQPLGYTIIELMIVLAVSGVMFVIAASFINGKQERASFTQGVNEMASRLQDTIEQVSDGKYSDILLNCHFNGGSTTFSGTTTAQGTNADCVFLGKILHFFASPDYKYETLSVAGGRVDSATNLPITTLGPADPRVIDDLTTQQTTSQQLDVQKITATSGGLNAAIALGFFQGQGSFETATGTLNGTLQDGPQTVGLYYLPPPNIAINYSTPLSANLKPADKADICLSDGTQYADIILGINSDQLNVNIKMDGTTKPATC